MLWCDIYKSSYWKDVTDGRKEYFKETQKINNITGNNKL